MLLIATDLDGTLLRPDRTVSPRTADALRRIASDGINVILVTGRPLRWLGPVYEELGSWPIAVCANGAVIYDAVADRVLRADPLAPELLVDMCARLRQDFPDVGFAVEVANGRRMLYDRAYGTWARPRDQPIREVISPDELCAAPAVKLLARSTGSDAADFRARVAACLTGLAEITHSSYSGLVEISAAGVTKAAGLAWVCERLGVAAADVVAFGDMPNDLPMLAWAGRAVAMANADPAVLRAAHEVTLSNEDDGVAAYLEEQLLARG